ncbi:MAG: HAD-IA family hydrolase, partial [Chloroflexia bacterium]|nr:HAD-IA family hydrolase [Chloroflexia bacterium]
GLLLGALTGRLHSSEALLARLGLRRYFSFYLYAGELGVFKPDPRMYQEALRRSRLPAAEVLLVGDRASDVRGARSMGLASLLICREGAPPAADAPSLSDLRELLDWF